MSKYKYEGYGVIRDTEIDFPYHTDDIAELLEEKDQQITDLQSQLAITEKALELAVEDKCKFENALLSTSLGIADGKVAVPKKEQYYIEQSKEMLENE